GTRAEMRKGILELPQETADTASHMRRVIVDQIEALAELNRIVARHSRSLDAVEPPARRLEPVEPVMRRAEPVEAAAHRGAARAEPPRTNGSPRPEPVRQRADITGMVVPPVMPARRAEAPSLSPAQAGGGRTGWLSELLTRASHEAEAPAREAPRETPREAPPPPTARPERHTVDSLDSLAVDIARMIDHDAVAELWDRYKRGERNVFTRKLYTMQGQKAFEEIRKRYRGDGDFKRTVDRYIGEFERLLEEVSRDERGQMLARTYLTSETGKVYTMLAHPARRFDSQARALPARAGARRARPFCFEAVVARMSEAISGTPFYSSYFKNSSFHSPSHFGASASDLIGSTMTCLCASSSVFCVRLEGTRPMSPRSFWPSGESTKSANRSAAWGCGAFAATAIACGRPTSGSTTAQSIGPPFALIESAFPL